VRRLRTSVCCKPKNKRRKAGRGYGTQAATPLNLLCPRRRLHEGRRRSAGRQKGRAFDRVGVRQQEAGGAWQRQNPVRFVQIGAGVWGGKEKQLCVMCGAWQPSHGHTPPPALPACARCELKQVRRPTRPTREPSALGRAGGKAGRQPCGAGPRAWRRRKGKK